jgi:hypothetical protein
MMVVGFPQFSVESWRGGGLEFLIIDELTETSPTENLKQLAIVTLW